MRSSFRRLAYVSGPIDAAKVYDEWRENEGSAYYGTIYLLELYQLLAEAGAEALVITTLAEGRFTKKRSNVTILNIPPPKGLRGLFYHLAMLGWAWRCSLEILRFKANAAILTAEADYFWGFVPLKWWGVRLIVSMHGTLWPKFGRRKVHQRLLDRLNGYLLYPACDHFQANSDEAIRQVLQAAPRLSLLPKRFVATYDSKRFASVREPSWPPGRSKFELLYVGRLVENKGVFEMVQMLDELQQRHPGRFTLDVCGSGSAEAGLAAAVRRAHLNSVITVHGECATEKLQELYSHCHAVLVPTRSDCEEGQPKTAIEAVLNFRPVVMSAACPVLADVALATVEAKVDDVPDYVSAIEKLSMDRKLYREKVSGAARCRAKFLDDSNSYGSVLRPALAAES